MINCNVCFASNPEDEKYCHSCGSPLKKGSNLICSNGHVYDSKLGSCPYCPSVGSSLSTETYSADSGSNIDQPSEKDKTTNSRTVIVSPEGNVEASSSKDMRRLIGWLVSYSLKKEGEDYRLYEGRNLISSDGGAHIQLSDPAVSSPHCMILYRLGKIKIKDELSTNGTYVNGVEIEESELKDGDVIKVGKTELKFRSSE